MPDASRFTLSLFDTNPAAGLTADCDDGSFTASVLGWDVPVPAAEAWPAPPATDPDDRGEQVAPEPAGNPLSS